MKVLSILLFLSGALMPQYDVETISGLVLINDRRPGDLAASIDLELQVLERPSDTFRAPVSPDGEYRFGSLRPGTYYITARAPGYKPVTIRVDLVRGSRTRGSTRLVLLPEMSPPGHVREGGVISQNELRAPREAQKEVEKAEKALEAGDLGTCTTALEKCLAIYPKYARALFQKGRLFELQRKQEGAVRIYEQAIQEDPDFFPAYARLSEIFREASELASLRKLADRWKRIQPLAGTPYYYSAFAYYEEVDYRIALDDALKARQFPHSNLPHLNLLLANCYVKLRNPKAAVPLLQEFLLASPGDPQAPQARKTLEDIQRLPAP